MKYNSTAKWGLILGVVILQLFLAGCMILEDEGVPAASKASNYYVSNKGDDDNLGTYKEPFETIQQGCDVLEPGDTLYILEGIYEEKLFIENSGTKNRMITIKPYKDHRVIIDGSNVQGESDLIYIENRSYIRIEGLELKNSKDGETPTGIIIEGSGTDIEIINNVIYNIESDDNAHAIAVYGTDGKEAYEDILISGNEVYDCLLGASEAIVVNGNVEGFEISNNIVHDNNNIGIDCIGFEETASENDQARDGLVSGNVVYNITSVDNLAYAGEGAADGIYVDGGTNIVVENNVVYNCDIGIEVASEHYGKETRDVIVDNNLVYGCFLYGIAIGGASEDNGMARDCEFSNNTLYNNTIAIAIQQAEDNYFHHNIIYDKEQLIEGEILNNIFESNWWYGRKWTYNFKPFIFEDPLFTNPEEGDFYQKKGYKGYGIKDVH